MFATLRCNQNSVSVERSGPTNLRLACKNCRSKKVRSDIFCVESGRTDETVIDNTFPVEMLRGANWLSAMRSSRRGLRVH